MGCLQKLIDNKLRQLAKVHIMSPIACHLQWWHFSSVQKVYVEVSGAFPYYTKQAVHKFITTFVHGLHKLLPELVPCGKMDQRVSFSPSPSIQPIHFIFSIFSQGQTTTCQERRWRIIGYLKSSPLLSLQTRLGRSLQQNETLLQNATTPFFLNITGQASL